MATAAVGQPGSLSRCLLSLCHAHVTAARLQAMLVQALPLWQRSCTHLGRCTLHTMCHCCYVFVGTPEAPPIIQPTGRKRRNDNFPLAPELSTPVLERVYSGVDGSSTRQRRKLQGHQQLSSSELQSSSSEAHALADAWSPSTRAVSAFAVTEDPTTARKQGAELQPPQAVPQHSSHSSSNSSSSKRRRRLQQAAGAKQRPGWTGLWWGDAGGVGVAAGPSHAVHTISTVMAVYTLDPATGLQTDTRTVALQDLFAPVGAANCK